MTENDIFCAVLNQPTGSGSTGGDTASTGSPSSSTTDDGSTPDSSQTPEIPQTTPSTIAGIPSSPGKERLHFSTLFARKINVDISDHN